MSTPLSDAVVAQLRIRSLGYLAPAFRAKVVRVCERMEGHGHDPVVFETLRLPALQAEYFRRGTSRQRDVLRSMHAYGLAVDLISQSAGWNYSDEWKADLILSAKAEDLTIGGLWKNPVDWPHLQWGTIPGAVPDVLVSTFNSGGLAAVWAHVGAAA